MWSFLRKVLTTAGAAAVSDCLWQQTLERYPFLSAMDATELARLRTLSQLFLRQKEFHGTQNLVITDAMAVAVAAQACLPILHLHPPGKELQALAWYDDFVGIVLHPDEVIAAREVVDDIGVVHQYQELLIGEAMQGGPIMLSWSDVTATDSLAGHNLVIHEFAHKLDMRDGHPDGCPPLPSGFLGLPNRRAAQTHWQVQLNAALLEFSEQVIKAERFGAPAPWLDSYAAESASEFFAVASEAYFVNRSRFGSEFPTLMPLFDGFYRSAA